MGDSPCLDLIWSELQPTLPMGSAPQQIEALARWIVDHATNWPGDAADQSGDRYQAFPFYALCGARSMVATAMARRLGYTAFQLNIYNFGEPGSGHATMEVWYDDAWHFYDVTYAGMFVRDGRVLSFAELRQATDEQLANELVVFGPGHDRWSNGTPVDNERRMRMVYTAARLRHAVSTSRLGSGLPVRLEVPLDASRVPIRVGGSTAQRADVHVDGHRQGISEAMDRMLGHVVDNFQPNFRFTNLTIGNTYELRFDIARSTDVGLSFQAHPSGVEVLSGSPWRSDRRSGRREKLTGYAWTLRFRALATEGSIAISHGLRRGEGLVLRQIDFGVGPDDGSPPR